MVLKRLILFGGLGLVVACGAPREKVSGGQATDPPPSQSASVFKQNCGICHGLDGKKRLAGASDLSVSTLSRQERIQVISLGRGRMAGFRGALTDTQIAELVDHLETLRQ